MAQEEQSIKEEVQEVVIKELIEQFLPKLQKYAKPMRNKLYQFLKENDKCLHLKIAGDEIILLVIDEPKITEFEVEDDGYTMYPVDKFIPMLVSGELKELLEKSE